ncbi:Transcription regulator LuxR, C-terminal [Moorella glycerini]|uniref:LuxR family regulatory protein n=1 Tax=Neomoorella stamsii TaxID=1266720 RepID=A0A9X7J5M0_9FIRM|nr:MULTISPECIES: hypothetical protein [Moorella]PRR75611.1 luxR family regulatory protein [Moorella stamsii]CEP66467.1 Transcription regulator LuxR, C-terminal [Moorella glycerini]
MDRNCQKVIDARLNLAKLELQVALLARAGLKRWEIATALTIQQGTVKSQLERVAAKFGSGWKYRTDIIWPELEEDVRQAVQALKEQGSNSSLTREGTEVIITGQDGSQGAGGEIAATAVQQVISFNSARRAMEGDLSPHEAAILQLQGLPSKAGSTYLHQARAVQWQLLLLGEGRVLHVGAAARFWMKPALSGLAGNRYIRYLHSDNVDEPYRPWWLPYTTNGRVRGTRAAYYKIGDASDGDYVCNYLEAWLDGELGDYVAHLHARMQQRWQALSLIARTSGRPEPMPPPTWVQLLAEARRVVGVS